MCAYSARTRLWSISMRWKVDDGRFQNLDFRSNCDVRISDSQQEKGAREQSSITHLPSDIRSRDQHRTLRILVRKRVVKDLVDCGQGKRFHEGGDVELPVGDEGDDLRVEFRLAAPGADERGVE